MMLRAGTTATINDNRENIGHFDQKDPFCCNQACCHQGQSVPMLCPVWSLWQAILQRKDGDRPESGNPFWHAWWRTTTESKVRQRAMSAKGSSQLIERPAKKGRTKRSTARSEISNRPHCGPRLSFICSTKSNQNTDPSGSSMFFHVSSLMSQRHKRAALPVPSLSPNWLMMPEVNGCPLLLHA